MNKFLEHITNGTIPLAEDWEEQLKEAHRISPSMTPRAFAAFKGKNGLNSYEQLAQSLQSINDSNLEIVDLACGDGHLIQSLLPLIGAQGKIYGIDMSSGELDIAKKNILDHRVNFILARAQKIPLQNNSTHAILCHMAIMLMNPIEPVISEIQRVLKNGGIFSAIIGGDMKNAGIYSELLDFIYKEILQKFPILKQTKMGDRRLWQKESTVQLFTPGFEFLNECEFTLEVKTTSLGAWEFIQDLYVIGFLQNGERQKLKESFIRFSENFTDSQGYIQYSFPMKKITFRKL